MALPLCFVKEFCPKRLLLSLNVKIDSLLQKKNSEGQKWKNDSAIVAEVNSRAGYIIF